MSRRGENIRKRKDGRWEARIIVSYEPNGKAKYSSVYGKSYQEVREKKARLAALCKSPDSCKNNVSPDSLKITVSQIMKEWLESRKDSVKESTYTRYFFLINQHLLPELGQYPLSSVTSGQLDLFLRRKLHSGRIDGRGGLSPKTVADIRSVILQGFEYARERGYPCDVTGKIFYPRNQQPEMEILNRMEQEKLEQVLFRDPVPLNLGILIALYGGLRIGEVCALQWKDFYLDAGTVRISKTMIRITDLTGSSFKKTKVIIDVPKTESSRRTIPLPSFVIETLRKQKRDGSCYVVTGTTSYLEPRMCLEKYKKVLKEAGLRSCTFHMLRHTFATRCVESDFDVKSLSEILGHANISTTLQRYVHPSMERKKEQMERLEKISIQGQKNGRTETGYRMCQ